MTVDQLRKTLNDHRLERGFSFERLAAEIGPDRVTTQTMRRFLAGEGEPSELTVAAIRAYLARQAPEAVAS